MINSSRRFLPVAGLVLVTLIWAAPPLFQKWLLAYFSNSSQNFWRYLTGFIVSVPFLVLKLRERKLRLRWHHLILMLWPAIPNVVNQYAGVECLKYLMPGFASVFGKINVFFAFGLSYWLFKDERWLFRSGMFLAGFLLALAGSVGLALLKPISFDSASFYRGLFWLAMSAPAWALYSVLIKKTTEELGANISFSLISFWTSVGFLIPSGWNGELAAIFSAPWQANGVLVVSAILAIGLAHPLYYYSVRQLGVSVCQVVLLSTPIPTILFSAYYFHEVLTLWQTLFGAVLIFGAALACLARKPAPIDPALELATSRDA